MKSGLRGFTLIAGVVLAIGGAVLWANGGGVALLIVGAVVLVTGALEPIYGRAVLRPPAGNWRPTDEKFIDPESGKLVTVWLEPKTGERRYVEDEGANRG